MEVQVVQGADVEDDARPDVDVEDEHDEELDDADEAAVDREHPAHVEDVAVHALDVGQGEDVAQAQQEQDARDARAGEDGLWLLLEWVGPSRHLGAVDYELPRDGSDEIQYEPGAKEAKSDQPRVSDNIVAAIGQSDKGCGSEREYKIDEEKYINEILECHQRSIIKECPMPLCISVAKLCCFERQS